MDQLDKAEYQAVDDDDLDAFSTPIGTGMRRLTKAEQKAAELSPEAKARVLAFIDEADRCRSRAAAEARFHVIG